MVGTLFMLSMYLIFDSVHGVQSGNVRALGKQFPVSVYMLVCYYVVGMPLALLFGFKMEMGVKGFWLGYLIALILMDIGVVIVVVTASWQPITAQK